MPPDSTEMKLVVAVSRLGVFCRRGKCVEVLRVAGFSEYAIKEGMKGLTKYFPGGGKYAHYRRHEFLQAFNLQSPSLPGAPQS